MERNIEFVEKILEMKLAIPEYQRPYEWQEKNVSDLLNDILIAITEKDKFSDFEYLIGTIIIHKEDGKLNIVDGQQRLLTLAIIRGCLEKDFTCDLITHTFNNETTKNNLTRNYQLIKQWVALKTGDDKEKLISAYKTVLQMGIIQVDKLSEAFQLFETQNNRGKTLEPHDLLKAHHLREMRNDFVESSEMKSIAERWENRTTGEISDLFNNYLYPIYKWSAGVKCWDDGGFNIQNMYVYKGIPRNSNYAYARRAIKASPNFQITEPFVSGKDFFDFVNYYLNLKNRIVVKALSSDPCFNDKSKYTNGWVSDDSNWMMESKEFDDMKEIINHFNSEYWWIDYPLQLFYCGLMYYCDKFNNLNPAAVKKIFTWAFMIRVDMYQLPYTTIDKYAIGEFNISYSNNGVSLFRLINNARDHREISNMVINIRIDEDIKKKKNDKRTRLYYRLRKLNGMED